MAATYDVLLGELRMVDNVSRADVAEMTELVSGGSTGYIPILSGGVCHRYTEPLTTLTIGRLTSSIEESDILFTAGATVSPPAEVKVFFPSFLTTDEEVVNVWWEDSPLTLTSSGNGAYVCIPDNLQWYEHTDYYGDEHDGEGYDHGSSYLSGGSFTCSRNADGAWVISAHSVVQYRYDCYYEEDGHEEIFNEGEEDEFTEWVTEGWRAVESTTSRTMDGLIASSTDGMATWSINPGVTLRVEGWQDDMGDYRDENSPATKIEAKLIITPCDVVVPRGTPLVGSSSIKVESGHKYELNVKYGAIAMGEHMEMSDEQP